MLTNYNASNKFTRLYQDFQQEWTLFSYLSSILNKNMFRLGIVLFPKADAAEDVMVATLAE